MTTEAIVARLRDLLSGEEYWNKRDTAGARSQMDILTASRSYLREGIGALADELQAGR